MNLAFTDWLSSLVHKMGGFALVYLSSSQLVASTLPKSHLCSTCIIFFILLCIYYSTGFGTQGFVHA